MNVSSNKTIFFMIALVFIVSGFFYVQFYQEHTEEQEQERKLTIGEKTYNLNKPDDRYALPEDLEEISGMTYYKDNKIICVQDESGEIFIYDLQQRNIVREEKFGKGGDYEGVEIVDETVYVLTSKGEIFYFPLLDNGIGEVQSIQTPLSSDNDSEGLGYLESKSSLMISTKETGAIEGRKTKDNAIYLMDPKNLNFNPDPEVIIDEDEIEDMLIKKNLSEKKYLPAKPSGVFNIQDEIVVLCSVGRMVFVYDSHGKLNDLVTLDRATFTQPEGIIIDKNGTLFISSEGDGDDGYILKFNPL